MSRLVLTVDDSRTIREMVSFTIKSIGYDMIEAEDGLAALELLKTHKPDLIISDVNMPNMDGFTLVKTIRERPDFKTTPILMLTTEFTDDKKSTGRSAGATGWIVKPFDPEKLIQVVQKICA